MTAGEHMNYAHSYVQLGDLNRALKHIDEALQMAPSHLRPRALNNKAGILAGLGKEEEAIAIWNDLTTAAPTLGLPHFSLGNVSREQGDIPSAIARFRRAIDLEPGYVPAIVNLAICHQKTRNMAEADRVYREAMVISPHNAQIIYNYAFLLFEVTRFQEARVEFNRVIAMNPRHVSAYNYIGLCHKAMNQNEAALESFNRALTIDPGYKYALDNRDLLLHEPIKKRGMLSRLFK
jgi:tetratricopeptide (TPR) repeat protein